MNEFLADFPEHRATVDVYAPGALSGGTAGSATASATAVPIIIVPSASNEASGMLQAAPLGLGGGRADYLGFHAGTATIRPGDELRIDTTTTYYCHGTADWKLATVVALSKST